MLTNYRCVIVVFFLYFFAVYGVNAQATVVDSLIREAAKAKTDSARINTLTGMAQQLADGDTLQAMILWEKTLEWARKSPDLLSEAKTYFNIGGWHYNHYRTDKAQQYNDIARKMVDQDTSQKAQILLVKIQINTANIFWQQNKVEEAMQEYLKVLPLLSQSGDIETLALVNTNIAILFSNQKQYRKSNRYFLESIRQYRHLLPKSHEKIADAYVILSTNALNDDFTSLAEGMVLLDSALHHLQFTNERNVIWAGYQAFR